MLFSEYEKGVRDIVHYGTIIDVLRRDYNGHFIKHIVYKFKNICYYVTVIDGDIVNCYEMEGD